jgi:N-acetylglucosaminyldiphosphoundecaprenol N-acetyl-beta-D-mannosaminyltransferase
MKAFPVFGVDLHALEIDDVEECVINAVLERRAMCVSSLASHGVVLARLDRTFGQKVARFEVLPPDGQPVRWLLNILHGLNLKAPVPGTDLMDRLCARCAKDRIGIYLYGSTAYVNEALAARLHMKYPDLEIVGAEPSVFRPLTDAEDEALLSRINNSGCGIVFIGLGCPLQENFASSHASSITAVQVCSGAAFDFIAGAKRRAPLWMRRSGMEWFHRFVLEPRRLALRYCFTNVLFLCFALKDVVVHLPKIMRMRHVHNGSSCRGQIEGASPGRRA